MINALFTGLFNLIINLVGVVLKPIDIIITSIFPDMSVVFNSLGGFFSFISDGLGWAVSFTGLSQESIQMVVMFYGFKLTAPVAFSAIKSALKWYKTLKP